MLELGFDGNAHQRLDNAAVVDFLTSAASALSTENLLSGKDVDELRVTLSAITSGTESRDRPVLLELDRVNADFLSVLRARYGTINLCLNLLRHSLRSGLGDTRHLLAEFGQSLVRKAELNFNRPVTLSSAGKPQKHALYSTLIIDFSQALAEACQTLDTVSAELSDMHAHAMAGGTPRDTAVDVALAKALAFKGLTHHSLPGLSERAAKRKLATALLTLAEAAQGVAEAVGRTGHGYATALACEALTAECQRLQTLELPISESLVDWEVRRRSLIASLKTVNLALQSVARASLAAIGTGAPETPGPFPEAAKRRIVTDLIATGIGTKAAWSATESLFRYVEEQHVTADQLIPGELSRIHPALSGEALATLQRLAKDRSMMSEAAAEKAETMARAKKLAERFKKSLAELGLLALVVLAASGCGLKTRPTSEVVELRPDIPFREAPKLPGVPNEPPKQRP